MVHSSRTSFAVRARLGLIAPLALIMLTQVGCRQTRSSLRPVYLSDPIAPVVTREISPSVIEPANTPNSTPTFGDSLEPATPSLPEEVEPKATPIPRRPSGKEEPGLKSLELEPSSSIEGGPALTRPSASRTNPKARLAGLRSELRPFVENPDELFLPPKADKHWKFIVIHHSAHAEGGYAEIDREHRKALGIDGCGYHFVIGNGTDSGDGQIEVGRRWSNQKTGIHCRDAKNPDANEYGIGICLVGDLNSTAPTAKQIEATRALVAYLEDRYRIAADHVDTHDHLASSPTTCPGELFPRSVIMGTPTKKSRNVASAGWTNGAR